jgi:arylsulfatase A-like enzyme
MPTMRRFLASCAILTVVVLQLDWVTGAADHGAGAGPAQLLAAAALGAAIYGVASAALLAAALLCGSALRTRLPALAELGTARALAGAVLFLFVVHGLDRSWDFEPSWIPVAAAVGLGLRYFEPGLSASLAMGVFIVACVTLVATQTGLAVFSFHAAWALIPLFAIGLGVPWRHPAARWRVPLAFAAAGVAIAATFALAGPAAPRRSALAASNGAPTTNLLLVTIDTLRADALGVYGGPPGQTPRLDRAAASGAVFLNAYSPGPWTLPALAAVFAARPAGELRRGPYTYAPDADWTPLAERLRKLGYSSLAVISNPSLLPFTKGFDATQVLQPDRVADPLGVLPVVGHLRWSFELSRGRLPLIDTTRVITESALRFLARKPAGPFFLWLHYLDPHDPYHPPPEWRDPTPAGMRTFFAPQNEVGDPSVIDLQNGRTVGLDERFWNHVRRLYADEVRYVDAAVGRVLDALEAGGLAGDTLVVITSDHGEEFLEHGNYYHGQSLYNELLHVPLILVGPGIPPRTRVADRVGTIDIVPTLEDHLGVGSDPGHAQRSLLPFLREDAPRPAPREIVSQGTNHGEPRRALVVGDHKLILHRVTRRTELYDLKADPLERRDLSAQRPDLVKELLARLDAIAGAPAGPPPGGDDAEVVRRLRALGYVR